MPRRAPQTPRKDSTAASAYDSTIVDATDVSMDVRSVDGAPGESRVRPGPATPSAPARSSANATGFDYSAPLARGTRGRTRRDAGGTGAAAETQSGQSVAGRELGHASQARVGPATPNGGSPAATDARIPANRAVVSAQPITRKQAALVTRESQKLPGLAQTRTTKAVTIVTGSGDATTATTVLPAAKKPSMHAGLPLRPPARRGRRLSLPVSLFVAVVTLAVIAAGLYTFSPLSPIHSRSADFAPAGALLALSSDDTQPGGPWNTSAGMTEALGLGGGAGPGVTAPGSAGLPVGNAASGGNFTASPGAVFISAAPIAPWPPDDPFMAVPDHPAFRVNRPSDGYYWWAFGQCTWWAQYARRDENLTYLGNARGWAVAAQQRGYRVGHQAAPNATVVFYPGAQGAGGAGHVGHVEAVYPGGWFLVSEMNFYWNGGGWGRVDYRYVHEGWGVAFIY